MSSVITTRMFGRPSESAELGRACAGARAKRRNEGDRRRQHDRASARVPSSVHDPHLSAATVTACVTLCQLSREHPPNLRMSQTTRTRETREKSRARIVDAATELVRERSYAELNIGEIMERAGIGRTIFYRHFDDLADLLLRVAREAIEELYEAQVALAATRVGPDPANVVEAIELPVARLAGARPGPPGALGGRGGRPAGRRAARRAARTLRPAGHRSACPGRRADRQPGRRPDRIRTGAEPARRGLPARCVRPRAAGDDRGRREDTERDLDRDRDRRTTPTGRMTAGYWPRPWTCEDGGPRRWGSPHGEAGLGIRPGERLEVVAVRDAFATDALLRREPGELYALRHEIPLGGAQSTPVDGWVERLDPETLAVTASTPRAARRRLLARRHRRPRERRSAHGLRALGAPPQPRAGRPGLAPAARVAPAQLVRRPRRRRAGDQGLRRAGRARALDRLGRSTPRRCCRSPRRCAFPSPRSRGSPATARA